MKKSESKRSESKSSDTPARRGKADSLSQYMDTPPLAVKPAKKKAAAATPSILEVNQATLTEQDKTHFEVSDVMKELIKNTLQDFYGHIVLFIVICLKIIYKWMHVKQLLCISSNHRFIKATSIV